jgi:hypothetical protein
MVQSPDDGHRIMAVIQAASRRSEVHRLKRAGGFRQKPTFFGKVERQMAVEEVTMAEDL